MIALIQRVSAASVRIDGQVVGQIGAGLLALIGVVRGDDAACAQRLLARLLDYRVFPDPAGRMNINLRTLGGGLLLVPQFTLAADTHRGTRPGFSTAAPAAQAEALFNELLAAATAAHRPVAAGRFGVHMEVALTNDGPVTFWLEAAR
jgi:D-aminoacyl-tRNA deacylase